MGLLLLMLLLLLLGNLPMLVYIFLVGRSAFARRQPQSLNAATIYALFVLALLTAGGFASLWQETPFGFSLYVVLFALCGGIVGDVMMVTAFPYMTQFHPDFNPEYKNFVEFERRNLPYSNPDRPSMWPWRLTATRRYASLRNGTRTWWCST